MILAPRPSHIPQFVTNMLCIPGIFVNRLIKTIIRLSGEDSLLIINVNAWLSVYNVILLLYIFDPHTYIDATIGNSSINVILNVFQCSGHLPTNQFDPNTDP